jgi:hypothetical protein
MIPEALDELTGEERHQVYRMFRLHVYVHSDGDLDVRGVLRVVYPRTNKGLFDSVRRHGALISKYYFGEAALAWRFPVMEQDHRWSGVHGGRR